MKQLKTIEIVYKIYDGDWPREQYENSMNWFRTKYESIPEEFRHTVKVNIKSIESWEDTHNPAIVFSYERLETDQEERQREIDEAAAADKVRKDELNLLDKLLAKYRP